MAFMCGAATGNLLSHRRVDLGEIVHADICSEPSTTSP